MAVDEAASMGVGQRLTHLLDDPQVVVRGSFTLKSQLLKSTLQKLKAAAGDYHVHYAMKANTNDVLLKIIKDI